MALIDWIPSYNTEVVEIDIDNQQIVSIINVLHESMTKKDKYEIVNQSVYQLAHNFQDHCTITSQLLEQIKYPLLAQQQESHKRYGRILASFLRRVKKNEKISPMEMIGFLRNWFDKHIKIEDQKLKLFIRENNCNLNITYIEKDSKEIEWNSHLELNNKDIDKEHKHLVDLYNVFYRAIEAKKNKNVLLKILHAFKDYSELHFENEENVMKEIGYPELEEHAALHKKLIVDIEKLIDIVTKNNTVSNKKLLEYTRNWLVSHVVNDDKKLVSYLENANEAVV